MGYEKYGISKELVSKAKKKLKDPGMMERVKLKVKHVTASDLQNKAKIKVLIQSVSKTLGITVSDNQAAAITRFVMDQRIDPQNTLHLLRLWGMFR